MIPLFIYNLSIRLYSLSIHIASPFSVKAKNWVEGRKKLYHRLGMYVTSAHGKRIWFHCASLGEFEQVRPLLDKIRKLYPHHILILTFFSPSGFNVRRYYDGVDFVSYLPIDTAYDAKKFIQLMKPSLVIWVKYEFWYHMLYELNRKKIPIVLISSVFRPGQIFFKWYGPLHRKMLGYFSNIFVQNKESQDLLRTLHLQADVCPDTRFDRVYNIAHNHSPLANAAAFKADKKIFIAGSTWAKDAEIICEMINSDPFDGQFKYIIAPHDASRENIDYLLKRIGKKKVLLSRLTTKNAHKFDVAIVDTIGILSSLYHYGDIAYVGGGFNASVHNILEPAAYGMPVIFGPNYYKSEEAKTLISHPEWHVAYTVKNYNELLAAIRSLLENDEKNLHTGSNSSKEYVLSHTGGTERIYSYLTENGLLN